MAVKGLFLFAILYFSYPAFAWNIPGHILGAIAYQILERKNSFTVSSHFNSRKAPLVR